MKKIAFLSLAAIIFFYAGIITSCESSKSSASKMLKFNYEKGRGYDYDMMTTLGEEILGQDMKMEMNMSYSLDVTADDGNTRTINTEIKRLKMDMQMMKMKFSIDTDKPASAADTSGLQGKMSFAFSKFGEVIKGKKFDMKVDKEGKIVEVSGFDQIFSSIIDSAHMDAEERNKALRSFHENVNQQETMDQFTELFYIFPQKEVRVGDSWEKDYETKGKMAGKNHTVYKVKDIDGDMVTLSSKTEVESSEEKVSIKGTKTGKFIVDSRSGLVVNAELDYEFTFNAGGLYFMMKGEQKIKGTAR